MLDIIFIPQYLEDLFVIYSHKIIICCHFRIQIIYAAVAQRLQIQFGPYISIDKAKSQIIFSPSEFSKSFDILGSAAPIWLKELQ